MQKLFNIIDEWIFGKEEHMCIHRIDGTCEICERVNVRIRYTHEKTRG